MRRLRVLLLPFAAVVELFLFASCLVLALTSPKTAIRLADWATSTFPSIDWFFQQWEEKGKS